MSSGQRALFENNGSVNGLAQEKESGFKLCVYELPKCPIFRSVLIISLLSDVCYAVFTWSPVVCYAVFTWSPLFVIQYLHGVR
jgi:hypothetical protein